VPCGFKINRTARGVERRGEKRRGEERRGEKRREEKRREEKRREEKRREEKRREEKNTDEEGRGEKSNSTNFIIPVDESGVVPQNRYIIARFPSLLFSCISMTTFAISDVLPTPDSP